MSTSPKVIKRKQLQALNALHDRILYLAANQSFTTKLITPAVNLALALGCSLREVDAVFDSCWEAIAVQCEGAPC